MSDDNISQGSSREFIYGAKHNQAAGFLAGFLFGVFLRSGK